MACLCKANELGWQKAEVLGDRESAISIFEEALKTNNKEKCCPSMAYATVQTNLGCQYRALGQIEKARDIWLKSVKLGSVHAHYCVGCLLEEENDIRCIDFFLSAARARHQGAREIIFKRYP